VLLDADADTSGMHDQDHRAWRWSDVGWIDFSLGHARHAHVRLRESEHASIHNHNSPGFGTQFCAYHDVKASKDGSIACPTLPYIS
jgi:hypothetical protein